MKFTYQNIPPELAAYYAALISACKKTQGASGTARTRRKVHRPAKHIYKRKILRDYEAAVDALIEFRHLLSVWIEPEDFRQTKITELKSGYFDLVYWTSCTTDSIDTLENSPNFSTWAGGRAYAHADPYNRPSIALYGDGDTSSGDPAYEGATIDETYRDTLLRWQRIVFSLKNKFMSGTIEPLFLKITGTITASANVRASRAMISLVIKRWMVLEDSTRLTTTEAPVIKVISAYWRYKTPRGSAPYYNITKQFKLVYTMRDMAYEEADGDITKLVALVAPMPMMGKRYNNNTSVATSLHDLEIGAWQIRKVFPVIVGYSYLAGDEVLRAFRWREGVMTSLGSLGGTYTFAMDCAADGSVVVGGSYLNGGGILGAFRWENGIMTNLGGFGGTASSATGCSADGLTVVGMSTTQDDLAQLAFRWKNGIMTSLGTLGGGHSGASGCSADGLVVVGYSRIDETNMIRAFRWINGIMTNLGTLGGDNSDANGCSADGSVVVGYSYLAGNEVTRAFRWKNGIMTNLGTLGGLSSVATGCSADGSMVIGYSYLADNQVAKAFQWEGGIMADIGGLGGTYSVASAISG